MVCCPDKVAAEYLKRNQWNLEMAVDEYFQSGGSSSSDVDEGKIQDLFRTYRDEDEEKVGVSGMVQFLEHLSVNPAEVTALLIAWKFEGFKKLGVDSMDGLQAALPALKAEIDDPAVFKEFYMFSYAYSCEKGVKSLALQTAIPLWGLLLQGRWKLLPEWLNFLKEKHKYAIPRDTWSMVFDFMEEVKDSLDSYDDEGAYPVIIDEFVEYMNERK